MEPVAFSFGVQVKLPGLTAKQSMDSVTRFGDFLDYGLLFKAFGNN